MRLNIYAAGLAFGVFWAIGVAGVTLISAITGGALDGAGGYADFFVRVLMSVYPGYSVSVPGAIIGAVWALVDGFVSIACLGWLYNFFACRIAAGTPENSRCRNDHNEKQVQAQIFLSVDVQKTGTGNAAVAVPVPRFLQSGDFGKILVPVPVFHHIELKPAKFEYIRFLGVSLSLD